MNIKNDKKLKPLNDVLIKVVSLICLMYYYY